MRIGRFADPDGAASWALIDPAGNTVRCIDGDITEWAAWAALENADALPLHDPEPADGLRPLAPVDPGARIFGVGANYLAHLQKLGVTEPPAPSRPLRPWSRRSMPRRDHV